ncbi:MAG: SUMF1/EgtB/PvdO family nonheme iron enzyme, partial [Nitrospirae bacterium]|nr:SUMF1/EgtB/PvdO family nonheme iron enzyme [Nitrospirota bacterium]
MLWETPKETGVLLACIVGFVLGGHSAAAEWKYDSSGPPIESNFDMTKGKDGAPMIKIPEGEFLMGANNGPRNERPEHTVYLDSYYIDQFEVTMERYQIFLDETYHDLPPLWDDGAALEEAKDRP